MNALVASEAKRNVANRGFMLTWACHGGNCVCPEASAQAQEYRGGRIWKGVREVSWQAFVMKNCHYFTGRPPGFRAGKCGLLRVIAN